MSKGYWKVIEEADGYDTFEDKEVWVEVDENGREYETSETRHTRNSYAAKQHWNQSRYRNY